MRPASVASRTPGLRFTIPFYSRKRISLRARNLNGDKLKVNDKRGNPIEIAAVENRPVTGNDEVDHWETVLFDTSYWKYFIGQTVKMFYTGSLSIAENSKILLQTE